MGSEDSGYRKLLEAVEQMRPEVGSKNPGLGFENKCRGWVIESKCLGLELEVELNRSRVLETARCRCPDLRNCQNPDRPVLDS